MKAADPGPSGERQIKRIEDKGGVTVVQKDQNAVGESATFNMRENTVTLVGNVIVTRGQDVLRGQRLVVDLTNGVSKMDGGRGDVLIDTRANLPRKNDLGSKKSRCERSAYSQEPQSSGQALTRRTPTWAHCKKTKAPGGTTVSRGFLATKASPILFREHLFYYPGQRAAAEPRRPTPKTFNVSPQRERSHA
jgi:hypothetical protein